MASYGLKKMPLRQWTEANGTPEGTTIIMGLGWDEDDRRARTQKALAPWKVEFPTCWEPRMLQCDLMDDLRSRGIEPPALYDDYLAYPHNNCHGCCILAGIEQWAGVLRDFPDKFAEAEENERVFMAILEEKGRVVVSILKDRRGGETKSYSLQQLREDIEAGRRLPKNDWRTPCACMSLF